MTKKQVLLARAGVKSAQYAGVTDSLRTRSLTQPTYVIPAGSGSAVTRPSGMSPLFPRGGTTVSPSTDYSSDRLRPSTTIAMPAPGTIEQAARPSAPTLYPTPESTTRRPRGNSADFSVSIDKAVVDAAKARMAMPVTSFPRPTVVVVNPFGTPPPHNIGMQVPGPDGYAEYGVAQNYGGGGGGGQEEYDEDGPKQPPLPDVHVSTVPWWLWAALAYTAYKAFGK